MAAASAAARAARVAAGLSGRKTPMERREENPESRRLAMEAMCYQCQGEDADPCWQWRVGNCEVKHCALWDLRPHQRLYKTPTPKALLVQFDGEAA